MSAITHQELFDNFEVIRVLGEGSFGKVFLVRHKLSKNEYAMKKYSKYHILKNGKEKSLIRSSKILQLIEHKRIIKFLYYAIGQQDDEIFLIFEACKKGSLQQIKMKLYKMKEISLIKQVLYQLAESLKYLKSICVAHRDIKPSNISFTSNGDLKLIDFDQAICFKQSEQLSEKDLGFAKQLTEQTSSMKMYSRRSRVNSFVGTELYMSPQMRHNTITDERGDIWAYGCIFYELVAGKSLMDQNEEEDQIQVILEKVRAQLNTFNIPHQQIENIQDLLQKILQEDPDKRISVEEIMVHDFFREYKNNTNNYQQRLRKFLRGNHNVSDPKHVLDALNMDLIGMQAGPEKFLQLSSFPVMIQYKKTEVFQPNIFSRATKYIKSLFTFPFFKINFIMGGSRYFKVRSIMKESDKQYIFYDQIDTIRIQEDSILIQGSNTQRWNSTQKNKNKTCHWKYTIKAIDSNQVQLGILLDTLLYIFND